MANGTWGLPRTTRYARLEVEEHLLQLDNDLDIHDNRFDGLAKSFDDRFAAHETHVDNRLDQMQRTSTWILRTFVGLLVAVIGTLIMLLGRG